MGAPSQSPENILNLVCPDGELCPDGGSSLDTGALVSAADLQAAIDRVKIRSDELKDQVYATLTKHHEDLLQAVRTAGQTSDDVSEIETEVAGALRLLGGGDKDEGLGADIIASAAEHRKLQTEIAAKQRAQQAVSLVSSLYQSLQDLSTQIHESHFPEAARSVLSLEAKFRSLPEGKQSDAREEPKAFGFLREGLAAKKGELEAALNGRFADAVVVSSTGGEVRTEGGSSVNLNDTWQGLEILSMLDAKLERLAGQLATGPVTSCLSRKVEVKVVESSRKGNVQNSQGDEETAAPKERFAVLRVADISSDVSSGVSSDVTPPALADVYKSLLTLVRFLHERVMCGDRVKTLRLGKFLWPQMAKLIVDGPLMSSIPDDATELANFRTVADATAGFEKGLEAATLVEVSETGHGLSAFAADVDVHFGAKKSARLLARARGLFTQPDWGYQTVQSGFDGEKEPSGGSSSAAQKVSSSGKKERPLGRKGGVKRLVKEGGGGGREEPSEGVPGTSGRDEADAGEDASFFHLPDCQVSTAAQQIVQLAHEALGEATRASPRTAFRLLRAARDVLQMYRAIVPVQREHQLESVPQPAMVFYNDCLYIAHHALMLGLEYRNSLPAALRSVASVADLAPAFEQMADVTRDRQLRQQREELMRALDEGNGFRFTDEEVNFKAAERAIKKVHHILGHLSAIWRLILSRSDLHVMMTSLAETVVARVAAEVLRLDDIAVEETTQLRALLRLLLEGLPVTLEGAAADAAGKRPAAGGDLSAASRLVPTGPKLLRLIHFLDMSLRDINAAWESGNLSACGFQPTEVQRLIKSIFSDTPLQREVLARIEASRKS